MKPTLLGLAAAAMLATAPAFAQPTTGTTTTPSTTTPSTRTPPADHSGTMGTGTTTRSGVIPPGAPGNRTDQQAASGETNQAVATTSANAMQPAHGANSFTAAQAKSRMEKEGFANVTNLVKDDDGVWRGEAQKSGNPARVWLDYKGNVGVAQ